jgi:hypothetical protein
MFPPVLRQDYGFRSLTRGHDSDGLTGGLALNLIARFDVKAVGSYLQLLVTLLMSLLEQGYFPCIRIRGIRDFDETPPRLWSSPPLRASANATLSEEEDMLR